ncbi:hypothetical protein LUZ60_011617 [Juncus effusus]|nr:hypothetical protein LUZ60_011617 [Juncus effusus]
MKCTALFGKTNNLDNIKLILFPHTLGAAPRDWLNHLQGGPFATFDDVAKRFLKRYFPSTLTAKIRNEITNIQQRGDETLQEYYECFVRLCASCPNHNLNETSLLDQFIQGMNALEARLLQYSAGGSFNEKKPAEVQTLIETMAEGNLGREEILGQVNTMSTVDLKAMESRITANFEMKFNKVLKAVGARIKPTPGEFCARDHATDECDTLQDVNHVYGYQCPQYAYDLGRKTLISVGVIILNFNNPNKAIKNLEFMSTRTCKLNNNKYFNLHLQPLKLHLQTPNLLKFLL